MTTTKPKRVDKRRRAIVAHVFRINRVLGSAVSQDVKRELCALVESLLHDSGLYGGFNNLYWMQGGYKAWESNGKPEGVEKQKFIIGPLGVEFMGRLDFVNAREGEWARQYFINQGRSS